MKKHTHNGFGLTTAALLVGVLGLGNAGAAQVGGVVLKPMQVAVMPMRVEVPRTVQRMNPRIVMRKHLSCKVWGTPVEFPHSVLLTNDGSAVVAAGTRVHYTTRGGKRYGNYTFSRALGRGASVYAPLSGDWARGASCTVSFVSSPARRQLHTYRRFQRPQVVDLHKQPTVRLAPMHARCRTGGEGEFVNHAELTNDRPRPIPAGTRIHYAVNSRVQGNYTFTAPLNMNQHVWIKLPSYTAAGLSCSVAFVK